MGTVWSHKSVLNWMEHWVVLVVHLWLSHHLNPSCLSLKVICFIKKKKKKPCISVVLHSLQLSVELATCCLKCILCIKVHLACFFLSDLQQLVNIQYKSTSPMVLKKGCGGPGCVTKGSLTVLFLINDTF